MSRGFRLVQSIIRYFRPEERNPSRSSSFRSSRRVPRRQQRRLLCEPLEERQLLSFTVQSFTPTTTGFAVQLSDAIETSDLNLYDTQSGARARPMLLFAAARQAKSPVRSW